VLFNSFEFLVFLPIVFILYWFVFNKKLSWQNGLVLGASYFFYGWWSWKFMGLLMLSTLLDYLYGFWVASPNRKKAKFFLYLSILNNLGILGVFKYYNFFALQFQKGFDLLGLHTHPILLNVALPIGISFYTFHGMSYVFDIYRGNQKPVKSFVDYAVFVSFFPLLVAGPIERASHLLPQVQKKRIFSFSDAQKGIELILWGLVKKIIIADNLSPFVDQIFSNYSVYNGGTVLLGIFYFSIQIYCDFSGYSDMAMGIAKLFGFDLLLNFDFPYFSKNIGVFWKRWHISLTSWFRDYLYIPLGGSREGKLKQVRNTFIIFTVSGFWHGASWTFLIWGAIHAVGFLPSLFIVKENDINFNFKFNNKLINDFLTIFQIVLTFAFVSFCWIFFRAENISQAIGIIKTIGFSVPSFGRIGIFYIAPLIFIEFLKYKKINIGKYWPYFLILVLFIVQVGSSNQFIYFQF
jgi:alginate O-acetyltransferase complex protein AlgI